MTASKQLLYSYSVPNVNFVYVCLVSNITPGNPGKSNVGSESRHNRPSLQVIDNPNEEVGTSKDNDVAIEVQRSVAFHELIESYGKLGNIEYFPEKIEQIASETIPLPPHEEEDGKDDNKCGNPKILSLTKTKWLSESRDGSPDARDILMQSTSESSVGELPEHDSTHKALSTVLALDKEHNLFGLSNTYIPQANSKAWKKLPKESDSKAVFHQTAIVQACYKTRCRRKSKTDLPPSLKCGCCKSKCCCAKCRSCTSCTTLICRPSCSTCAIPCTTPCSVPCGSSCVVPCPLYWGQTCFPKPCSSTPCPTCSGTGWCAGAPACSITTPDCSKECPRFGFQVSVIKKPKYDPVYTEIEPKSSCVLSKPLLARRCHHRPRCSPPSECFPYLMPCYWPSRCGAPCSEPSQCFHNPPCLRGRTRRGKVHPLELCPRGQTCGGKDKGKKCENYSCIGRNNEALAEALTKLSAQTQPVRRKWPSKY